MVNRLVYYLYRLSTLSANKIRSLFLSFMFPVRGKNLSFGKIGTLRGLSYIKLGSNCTFGDFLYLTAWDKKTYIKSEDNNILEKTNKIEMSIQNYTPFIFIGDNCHFGAFNHISSCNSICIGNNVLTGKFVSIIDNSHGLTTHDHLKIPPALRPLVSKGSINIEDDVWIGEGSVILPGVTIGKGSIIGANSVVTKNIPPFSVYGGIPAVKIR